MNEIRLSYLMTTRNKLPYLKEVLTKLTESKKNDEEIIIADGASTDGTKEYLQSLKQKALIDHYISEPDSGEAHGLNKLFLMAKGEVMTIITDDDVFHFPTIQIAKHFMLENPEIDLLGTNGGSKDQLPNSNVRPFLYESNYLEWQKKHTPFSSCGVGLFFRRSSIPLLGLWNTSFKQLDAEFMFRNTFGKTNIAWYTGHTFVNISNPQSTTLVHSKRIKRENDYLKEFYLNKKPKSYFNQKSNALFYKIKSGSLFRKRSEEAYKSNWQEAAEKAAEWLEQINKEKKSEFLTVKK